MSRITATSFLSLSFILPMLAGCPNDISSPAGGTETEGTTGADTTMGGADESSSGTGSADDESGDTTAETTGSPPPPPPPPPPPARTLNCFDEYAQQALENQTVVDEPPLMVDVSELCADLPNPSGIPDYPILVFRPEDPATEAWPSGPRPWVLLQAGNGQSPSQYSHLVDPLVERGFVVFAPDDGNVAIGDLDYPPWDRRSDNMLCSLRAIAQSFPKHSDDPENGHLGDCFGMVGHSNGGAGAAGVAAKLRLVHADPMADELGAIVAIAPAGFPEVPDLVAEYAIPLMVLVGSHDEDTGLGGSNLHEVVSDEGALERSTGLPGSEPGRVGEKVLVEAFNIPHNDFGGVFGVGGTTAGQAIAAAYVPPFLYWQFFGEHATNRARFADNEIPDGLDAPIWWDSLDQWSGTPLIYTAYQMGDRRGIGVERYVVATLEGSSTDVLRNWPGEGTRLPSMLPTSEGRQNELYGVDLDSTTFNRALRVDWGDLLGSGGVTWEFAPPPFPATHLSLRVHNVFDGWDVGQPDCIASTEEVPLSFDVHVQYGEDENLTATVQVSDVVVQDYSFAPPLFPAPVGSCDNTQTLYGVRIPLSCLSTPTGAPIDVSSINSIQLRFGDSGSSPVGAVVVDSIEFTSSPEEPPGSPDCGHLGAVAPPPLSGLAYTCVDYSPEDYVGFTEATNPAPGEPLGELTFDGRFASFVAGRPGVLADCDNARYELDDVRVDSDSDGSSDSTLEVRAVGSLDPTDLVALLGLQEGDAAITINEPGKEASNGIELYDFGSFLAASKRFSALQDLEVRFLREQPSGVHQPVRLNAYVPADFSGVAAPQPPASPQTYTLPSGATYVSTSAELVAELALPGAHDIIIADGDYTWTGPVTIAGPHRVWSDTLHGVTLHFGLTYAGNADRTDGLELHGLDFQLDNAAMAPAGVGSTHILFTWGQGGEDVLVEDCAFDGGLVIGDAIGAFAPSGLVVRRSTISNFWSYGIIAKQGGLSTVLASEPLIEDLQIQSIFGANPGASNGARENGILLGNNGTIARVDIRDVGWSAIQLYNDATGVSIEDVFLDYAGPDVWSSTYASARGAGIWLGQSHDVTIERVRIESHVFLGINVHWDTGNPNPFANTTPPRNHNITISDLYSRAYKVGVHLDLGVEDTVVRSSRFEHAWMAGVLDNNRFEDDWGWHPCPGGEDVCLESPNRTESIDCYLQDGVECVAHHHGGGATATPPASWPPNPDDYLQPGGLWNRDDAAYPTEPVGGGDSSSGGQVDSSSSG